MKDYLDQYQMMARLEKAVNEAGNQLEFARLHGISQQYVNDVWNGRRDPGRKILAALGLRRVVVYSIIETDGQEK